MKSPKRRVAKEAGKITPFLFETRNHYCLNKCLVGSTCFFPLSSFKIRTTPGFSNTAVRTKRGRKIAPVCRRFQRNWSRRRRWWWKNQLRLLRTPAWHGLAVVFVWRICNVYSWKKKAKFVTGHRKIAVFATRHPKIVYLLVDTVKKW